MKYMVFPVTTCTWPLEKMTNSHTVLLNVLVRIRLRIFVRKKIIMTETSSIFSNNTGVILYKRKDPTSIFSFMYLGLMKREKMQE